MKFLKDFVNFIKIKELYPEYFNLIRTDRGAKEYVVKKPDYWNIVASKIYSGTFLSHLKINAFSYREGIYWPSFESMENTPTLKHELSHIADYRKYGSFIYYILYKLSYVLYDYTDNPFEIKARAAECRKFNATKKRKILY